MFSGECLKDESDVEMQGCCCCNSPGSGVPRPARDSECELKLCLGVGGKQADGGVERIVSAGVLLTPHLTRLLLIASAESQAGSHALCDEGKGGDWRKKA